MAEYINKAELMENYPEFGGYTFADVTTIDIVHCKDCKYAEVADMNDHEDGYTCQHIGNNIWFSGSYCSWGERKKERKWD